MKFEYNGKEVRILPPVKRYVNQIERKLNLPHAVRARVMSDFATSICARAETGESYESIMASLGSPAKVAAELNEQMKEYAYRKSPWRFVFLALAIGCALWLIGQGVLALAVCSMTSVEGSIGIIGGADGPTAIFVATRPALSAGARIAAAAALLIAGVVGFWHFGHLKQNDPEE